MEISLCGNFLYVGYNAIFCLRQGGAEMNQRDGRPMKRSKQAIKVIRAKPL